MGLLYLQIQNPLTDRGDHFHQAVLTVIRRLPFDWVFSKHHTIVNSTSTNGDYRSQTECKSY